MRSHALALVSLVSALLVARATVAETPVLRFEFQEGLLWIKVTVPQSAEPLNFLFDTGAGASVVNRGTADRLGLKLGGRVAVRGVSSTFTGRWLNTSARSGEVRLPPQYIAVDLRELSKSCRRPVDGLLGADFFRERIVQIDFEAKTIRLLAAYVPAHEAEGLPLQMRPCGMRVPITVNGHSNQWVRLDTGCATALQWVTARVRPEDCKHQVAVGLAELSIPQTQTEVWLGANEFHAVPTGIHAKPIFAGEAGLLGNGLLSRFSKVTIDAKSSRLFLEPRTVAP